MTTCEQTKKEVLPAAAGELVAEGRVAKLEGGPHDLTPVFLVPTARETGEFRNDLAKSDGGEAADPDLIARLPQVVLTNRRGRPATLTPQLQEQLCLLLSVGLTRRQAAAHLGVDHTTLSHTASRDAEFAADLKRSEEVASGLPLLAIFEASRKNWRAAVWLVEHRRQFPPALTPEEKAEKHREKLEDGRRMGELAHVTSRAARGDGPSPPKKKGRR